MTHSFVPHRLAAAIVLTASALVAPGCALTLTYDECTVDADCASHAAPGGASYCTKDHLCVGATPQDRLCPDQVIPTDSGPHLVVATLVDRIDPLDHGMENAFLLALDEINANQVGLGQPTIEVHICDMGDTDNGMQSAAAVQYAWDNYHISAVLGPTSADDVIQVTPIAKANGILVISPSASSVQITTLVDDNYVWRTAASDVLEASVLTSLVQMQTNPAPTAVDMLYVNNDDGKALEDAIQIAFIANNNGGPNDFMFKNVLVFKEGGADLASQIQKVDGDMPTDAVFIAEGDAPAMVDLLATEPYLGTSGRFYLTDAAKTTDIFGTAANPAPTSVLSRIRGTAPATPAGATFELFRSAYMLKYGVDPKDSAYSANAYDAAYVMATAAAATAGHPPSGAELRDGMMKLQSTGDAVPVGGDNYGIAVGKMINDGGVRLVGASGSLDFDKNGDLSDPAFEVWGIDTTTKPGSPSFCTFPMCP